MLLVLLNAFNWRVAIVTKKPFFSKWHDDVGMKNCLLNEFCFCLGGYDGKKYLNTTEIIYPNGSKTEGPELPQSRDGHCLVEYAGIIISMGGQYETQNDQFWSNTWIPELCYSDLGGVHKLRLQEEGVRWSKNWLFVNFNAIENVNGRG